jgi:hypothetical protein
MKHEKKQANKIKTEMGLNLQAMSQITSPGRIQNAVAGLGDTNPLEPMALKPYGENTVPTNRDLNLERSMGATKGLSIDLATTGKMGEKAK